MTFNGKYDIYITDRIQNTEYRGQRRDVGKKCFSILFFVNTNNIVANNSVGPNDPSLGEDAAHFGRVK